VCIYDVVVSKRRTAGENFKGDNAKREVIGSVVVADMQQDFGCDVPFKNTSGLAIAARNIACLPDAKQIRQMHSEWKLNTRKKKKMKGTFALITRSGS